MNVRACITLTVATMVLLAACKKDEADPSGPAPSPNTPAVNALFALFQGHVADATQAFTLNATTGGWVSGQNGVSFYFPANAFRTTSGGMVTGSVQLELVEALSVGDMLWLNKQTLGNDNGQMRPLVSGGQYSLKATQGGQQLRLAEDAGQVWVPAPNGVDPNMGLFSGMVENDGTITWDPFGPIGGNGMDSTGYNFPNDSLGWVNCDYFMGNAGVQTSVQITCPAGYSDENTIMWLVFPDQNSMTGLYNSTNNVFSTGAYYSLPVGLTMTVVAISNVGGTYTSSFTPTVVSEGMDLSIMFTPTTLAQFESAVQAL